MKKEILAVCVIAGMHAIIIGRKRNERRVYIHKCDYDALAYCFNTYGIYVKSTIEGMWANAPDVMAVRFTAKDKNYYGICRAMATQGIQFLNPEGY